MNKTLKTVLISVGATVVVMLLAFWLIGNQSADTFGASIGINRYPNSGIAARAGYFGSTIPSSLTDGSFSADGTVTLSGTNTLTGTNRITRATNVGTRLVLTSAATTSISGAQVVANGYVEFFPTVANASATLPTQAALVTAGLNTAGDSIELVWRNSASNATATTIFAAGASTTLQYANSSSSAATYLELGQGDYANLKFQVASTSDATAGIVILVERYQ